MIFYNKTLIFILIEINIKNFFLYDINIFY